MLMEVFLLSTLVFHYPPFSELQVLLSTFLKMKNNEKGIPSFYMKFITKVESGVR